LKGGQHASTALAATRNDPIATRDSQIISAIARVTDSDLRRAPVGTPGVEWQSGAGQAASFVDEVNLLKLPSSPETVDWSFVSHLRETATAFCE